MSDNRFEIEVFSGGCDLCTAAEDLVRRIAPPGSGITVRPLLDAADSPRARERGVRSVPAVAVNGKLAECCTDRGVDEKALRDTFA